jgi:hypothetical protein
MTVVLPPHNREAQDMSLQYWDEIKDTIFPIAHDGFKGNEQN